MGNYVEEKEDMRITRTKKLLSKALIELLENDSIERINIKDICTKAMVHRTTFYKHFSDKYDLFSYVFDSWKDSLYVKAVKNNAFESPKEVYMNVVKVTFDFLNEYHDHLRNMIKNNDSDFLRSLCYESCERAVKSLIEQCDPKLKIPLKVVANFYTGGFISLAFWWLNNPQKYTKEEMIAYIDELIDEKFCGIN